MASGNPIVATALVEIKPDPASLKTFASTVRTKLSGELKKNPIKLPVAPTISGPWKRKVQTELRTAKLTVPVTPVLTAKGRTALANQVRTQIAGMTVPIAIAPTGGPAATSGAGQVQALGLAESELAKAGLTAAESQAILNKALGQGAVIIPELIASTTALNSARTQSATTDTRAAERAAALQTANFTGLAVQKAMAEALKAGALAETQISEARARHSALTALSTDATKAYQAALVSEDAALIKLTKDLRAELVAQTQTAAADIKAAQGASAKAAADRAAAASSAARVRQERLLARGLLATALAQAGARGATLAASQSFLIGAASAVALFKSVSLAAKLEEELNVFQQTAGATADEMERVSEKAKQLGADVSLPAVSANDAAVAMTELAKAGLSVEDSMDAARGSLQLATAAQIDNAEAVNITASALNAFGLEGSQATHVADLLAGAANEAQGGIAEMGGALSSVSAVARQAGISVEDTAAFLTLLAKNGIQGAESGTALRVAILRLIAPTKAAKEQLDALGIRVLDLQGNLRPQVFADIADATNLLAPANRNAALQIIFGTRAIRAQAVLGRENRQGLNDMREATNKFGLAAELANARTRGFSGQVESLKNTAATTGLNIGQVLIPALDVMLKSVQLNIEAVNVLIEGLKKVKDVGLPGFDLPGEEQVDDRGPRRIGRLLDEATKDIPGLGRFFDPLEGLSAEQRDRLKSLSPVMKTLSGDTLDLAVALAKANREFERQPDELAIASTGAIKFVDKLKDNIEDTTPNAEELRNRLEKIKQVLVDLGRAPTALELKILFETGGIPDQRDLVQDILNGQPPLEFGLSVEDQKTREEAARSADVFRTTFGDVLSPAAAQGLGFEWMFNVGLGAGRAAPAAATQAAGAFTLETQRLLAEAAGDQAGQLAILQEQLANAERRLERRKQRFREAPGPGTQAAVQNAARQVTQLKNAIQAIVDEQNRETQSAADDIAQARNEADQKFLDALGLGRARRENAILRAEGRAGLEDDIRTQIALRNFLVKKREEAAKTLRDAKTKAQTVASLTADIIRANQEIRDLTRQMIDTGRERFEQRLELLEATGSAAQIRRLFEKRIAELKKALVKAKHMERLTRELRLEIIKTQQSMRDALSEGFELDIAFAETTGNEALERQFRERYIRFLERQLAGVKKGTLEWKRIRNAIAEQRAAIKDAKGEAEATFHEMAFDFLTRQQGFAANVMGNLLAPFVGSAGFTMPSINLGGGGFTGGGGGGGGFESQRGFGMGGMADRIINENLRKSDKGGRVPTQGLQDRAGAAAAGERGGTPAQFATIIHLLSQMVRLLGGVEGRTRHPESKTKQRHSGGSMDTM